MASGRNEFETFDTSINKILAVSHDELKRREEKWKKQRAAKRKDKKK